MMNKKMRHVLHQFLHQLHTYRTTVLMGMLSAFLFALIEKIGFPLGGVLGLLSPLPLIYAAFMDDPDCLNVAGLTASLYIFLFLKASGLVVFILFIFFPLFLLKLCCGDAKKAYEKSAFSFRSLFPNLLKTVEMRLGYLFLLLSLGFGLFFLVTSSHVLMPDETVLVKVQYTGPLLGAQKLGLFLKSTFAFLGMVSATMIFIQFFFVRWVMERTKRVSSAILKPEKWTVFTGNYWLTTLALMVATVSFPNELWLLGMNFFILSLIPFFIEGFCIGLLLCRGSIFQHFPKVLLFFAFFLLWPFAIFALLGFVEPWVKIRQYCSVND